MVSYLAGPESAFITGASVRRAVCGGWLGLDDLPDGATTGRRPARRRSLRGRSTRSNNVWSGVAGRRRDGGDVTAVRRRGAGPTASAEADLSAGARTRPAQVVDARRARGRNSKTRSRYRWRSCAMPSASMPACSPRAARAAWYSLRHGDGSSGAVAAVRRCGEGRSDFPFACLHEAAVDEPPWLLAEYPYDLARRHRLSAVDQHRSIVDNQLESCGDRVRRDVDEIA